MNILKNKSQSARSHANSNTIYAFFVIFKTFLYTDTSIGNDRKLEVHMLFKLLLKELNFYNKRLTFFPDAKIKGNTVLLLISPS